MDTQQPMQQAPQAAAPKQHNAALVFFMYFLVFVLLYTVAISLGGTLFQLINKYIPQVGQYYYQAVSSSLRYNLSALIIGTPLFLWLSVKIHRDAMRDEAMRQSGVRRWLTFLTLIVAALIVIGDLIALVYSLLGGETTMRFILKALTVLIIAGSVFYYYLTDVKNIRQAQQAQPLPLPRIYFWATSIVVLAAVVTGLINIESPLKQRMRSQDDVRVQNLANIEYAISDYARINRSLPGTLAGLSLMAGTAEDPITKQPYVYKKTSDTAYQLCATFETSNKEKTNEYDPYGGYNPWLHDAGETCFNKSIAEVLNQINGKPIPAPVTY